MEDSTGGFRCTEGTGPPPTGEDFDVATSQRSNGLTRAVQIVVSVVLTALLLLGLAAAGLGGWFIKAIGFSGAAEFTTAPERATVLVLGPEVLARTETPVTIRIRASADTALWAGLARPGDAQDAVASAQRTTVNGVTIDGWKAQTTEAGSEPGEDVSTGDIWTRTVTGDGDLELTVARDQGAQTLVVTGADGGPVDLDEVSLTWENGNWFFQALLLTLAGLIVALAAGWLLVHRIRAALSRRRAGGATAADPEEVDAHATNDQHGTDGTHGTDGAPDTDGTHDQRETNDQHGTDDKEGASA